MAIKRKIRMYQLHIKEKTLEISMTSWSKSYSVIIVSCFHHHDNISNYSISFNTTSQLLEMNVSPYIMKIPGVILKTNKLIVKYEMTNVNFFSIKVMIKKAVFVKSKNISSDGRTCALYIFIGYIYSTIGQVLKLNFLLNRKTIFSKWRNTCSITVDN